MDYSSLLSQPDSSISSFIPVCLNVMLHRLCANRNSFLQRHFRRQGTFFKNKVRIEFQPLFIGFIKGIKFCCIDWIMRIGRRHSPHPFRRAGHPGKTSDHTVGVNLTSIQTGLHIITRNQSKFDEGMVCFVPQELIVSYTFQYF